jgi:hypothetical protein
MTYVNLFMFLSRATIWAGTDQARDEAGEVEHESTGKKEC